MIGPSPDLRLDVNGAIGNSTTSILEVTKNDSGKFIVTDSSSIPFFDVDIGNTSIGIGLASTSSSPIRFGKNGVTEFARFSSSDNLLIGTTIDNGSGSKLQIQSSGDGLISTKTTSNSNLSGLVAYNDIDRLAIFGIYPSGLGTTGVQEANNAILYTASNDMAIAVDGASNVFKIGVGTNTPERFRINGSNGYVGIGTTNPGYNLDVNGNIRSFSSSANVGIALNYTGTNGRVYSILSCFNCGSAGLGGLEVYDATASASRAYIAAGVNGWQTPSDRRLKSNIQELSVLDKISFIRGASYILNDSGKEQIGVIAQEIKEVFPFAVTGSESEGHYLGVSYDAIASIALQGVKELNIKIEGFSSLNTSNQNTLGSMIKNFLGDFGNTIVDLFAKKIHTEELCIKKSNGQEICINGDNLESLINSQNLNTNIPNPTPEIIPIVCTPPEIINPEGTSCIIQDVIIQPES